MMRFSCIGALCGRWTLITMLVVAGCGRANQSEETIDPDSELGQISKEISAQPEAAADSVANVKPLLKCVETLPGGQFKAHFGFNNTTTSAASIPVGDFNRFVPGAQD